MHGQCDLCAEPGTPAGSNRQAMAAIGGHGTETAGSDTAKAMPPHQALDPAAADGDALAAQGILKPAIAATYKLENFVEAMEAAAAGQSAGRILLVMD